MKFWSLERQDRSRIYINPIMVSHFLDADDEKGFVDIYLQGNNEECITVRCTANELYNSI